MYQVNLFTTNMTLCCMKLFGVLWLCRLYPVMSAAHSTQGTQGMTYVMRRYPKVTTLALIFSFTVLFLYTAPHKTIATNCCCFSPVGVTNDYQTFSSAVKLGMTSRIFPPEKHGRDTQQHTGVSRQALWSSTNIFPLLFTFRFQMLTFFAITLSSCWHFLFSH